jgi:hypothetical protein
MTLLLQQLEARLPRSASDNSKHNLRAVFGVADAYRQKAEAIRSNDKLSYVGKDEALAALRVQTLQNEHLQQIRSQSTKAQERLRTEREALRAASLNPEAGDVIAEAQRAEIRGMLRALPVGERLKLATSGDQAFRDAVAFAHPALSGIPQDIHGKILDTIVEAKNQSRNSELAELETEAEVIAAAIAVAEGAIARG